MDDRAFYLFTYSDSRGFIKTKTQILTFHHKLTSGLLLHFLVNSSLKRPKYRQSFLEGDILQEGYKLF